MSNYYYSVVKVYDVAKNKFTYKILKGKELK